HDCWDLSAKKRPASSRPSTRLQHLLDQSHCPVDRKAQVGGRLGSGRADAKPLDRKDPAVFARKASPPGADARLDDEPRRALRRDSLLVAGILAEKELPVGHRDNPYAPSLLLQLLGGFESQRDLAAAGQDDRGQRVLFPLDDVSAPAEVGLLLPLQDGDVLPGKQEDGGPIFAPQSLDPR